MRTAVDVVRFKATPRSDDRPFTVVWTGSHSTLAHLESLRDVFRRVGQRTAMCLRVVCDERPPDFDNVSNEFVRWSPDTEVTALQDADVGIMPLPDTVSARGKCGFKAVQYMAVGNPAIVTPVGINREIVVHGTNGLWASTDDEWVDALLRLAGDQALCRRLGDAGRKTVEREYSVDTAARAFANVVRRVVKVA